ncbi:MAG: sodium:solute symporter family protein, partial [Ignavibacteriaceae bacterium]|nr:sodium:solute symporter family protein [Ignavibacteriaceae bacterium]
MGGRKVGLLLFIITNVSTWYGGILGVGEFTYSYGIISWVTQGLPYYIFAFLFAIFFAEKIHLAGLFTIPEKLKLEYGELTGKIGSVFVFFLVSPAPYFLMLSVIFQAIFGITNFWGLILAIIISVPYMISGGYKSDLYTDVFEFVIMFLGFILIFLFSYNALGDFTFLAENLPNDHLTLTGGVSPLFLIVWFTIALWTFADPGFHQRTTAAKSAKVAKWGIILSIPFWALFDFLTTSTGLYARAALPNIENPSFSYLFLAEQILSPGFKGLFYAALFATILSTTNSFVFLSGTTIGNDFFPKFKKWEYKILSRIGMIITSIFSFLIAYFISSVIEIWYTIGSIFIPGLILLVFGAYFQKLKISYKLSIIELIVGSLTSLIWFILQKNQLLDEWGNEIEP